MCLSLGDKEEIQSLDLVVLLVHDLNKLAVINHQQTMKEMALLVIGHDEQLLFA